MSEEKKQAQNHPKKQNQGAFHHHRRRPHNKNKSQASAVKHEDNQAKPLQKGPVGEEKGSQVNQKPTQSSHSSKPHNKQQNQSKKNNNNNNNQSDQTSVSKQQSSADAVSNDRNEGKRHSNRGNRHQKNRANNSSAEKKFESAPAESPASSEKILKRTLSDDEIFGISPLQSMKKSKPVRTHSEPDEPIDIPDEILFGTSHLIHSEDEIPEGVSEIVGIRYKDTGKIYYFDPDGASFSIGDFTIVDTARGIEFGEVCIPNRKIKGDLIVHPLRKVLRKATNEDIEHNNSNKKKEAEAFSIALEKIKAHKLDMKLVEVQYEFDNSKLLFYFTSAGRVDFRELVRDLASVFKTRIELRQIGIRDEAKMLGGIGMCGRSLCCSKYLSNFAQVSIKMAKEQGLSLNSNKISGNCGRLMCCLNFENQVYLDEIKITPMQGSVVKIGAQKGTVTDANPLTGMLKVHIIEPTEGETISVHRDNVTIISKKQPDITADSTADTESFE